jgi:hypothetical protein
VDRIGASPLSESAYSVTICSAGTCRSERSIPVKGPVRLLPVVQLTKHEIGFGGFVEGDVRESHIPERDAM